jgi:hypothetical protein
MEVFIMADDDEKSHTILTHSAVEGPQTKDFDLGDKYHVICETKYISPADSQAQCFVSTKNGEPRAKFDFNVDAGKVLKAEAALSMNLLNEIKPASDDESKKNFDMIKEAMVLKHKDWQVVSVIPDERFEKEYGKVMEEKWGADVNKSYSGSIFSEDTYNKELKLLKTGRA